MLTLPEGGCRKNSAGVLAGIEKCRRGHLRYALRMGFCDTLLRAVDKRLLLALDEYEYLDRKFGGGVFDEDLLTLIRGSIYAGS